MTLVDLPCWRLRSHLQVVCRAQEDERDTQMLHRLCLLDGIRQKRGDREVSPDR